MKVCPPSTFQRKVLNHANLRHSSQSWDIAWQRVVRVCGFGATGQGGLLTNRTLIMFKYAFKMTWQFHKTVWCKNYNSALDYKLAMSSHKTLKNKTAKGKPYIMDSIIQFEVVLCFCNILASFLTVGGSF